MVHKEFACFVTEHVTFTPLLRAARMVGRNKKTNLRRLRVGSAVYMWPSQFLICDHASKNVANMILNKWHLKRLHYQEVSYIYLASKDPQHSWMCMREEERQ